MFAVPDLSQECWKIRARWNIFLTMKARIQAADSLIPPWPEVCLCSVCHLSLIQSHFCNYVHKNKTSQRSQITSLSTDAASETSLMAADTDWRLWTRDSAGRNTWNTFTAHSVGWGFGPVKPEVIMGIKTSLGAFHLLFYEFSWG